MFVVNFCVKVVGMKLELADFREVILTDVEGKCSYPGHITHSGNVSLSMSVGMD